MSVCVHRWIQAHTCTHIQSHTHTRLTQRVTFHIRFEYQYRRQPDPPRLSPSVPPSLLACSSSPNVGMVWPHSHSFTHSNISPSNGQSPCPQPPPSLPFLSSLLHFHSSLPHSTFLHSPPSLPPSPLEAIIQLIASSQRSTLREGGLEPIKRLHAFQPKQFGIVTAYIMTIFFDVFVRFGLRQGCFWLFGHTKLFLKTSRNRYPKSRPLHWWLDNSKDCLWSFNVRRIVFIQIFSLDKYCT